jgi:predicted HicB family RNase H-like nuclease
MAIAKRPRSVTNDSAKSDDAASRFIAGAEKSEAAASGKAKKVMTTLRFDPKLLERIDAAAARRGISRAAWINYMLSQALEDEDQG